MSSRLSIPVARKSVSPARLERPKSAPPGGAGGRLIHKEPWRRTRPTGEKSDAFTPRYGWLTKLPANDPSFLEKLRKENGESGPQSKDDVKLTRKTLRNLNRPHSAPPRARGGGKRNT
eukprot:COSAG06_NODE_23031_length_704_cov_1.709091_1_plen_118_part_00